MNKDNTNEKRRPRRLWQGETGADYELEKLREVLAKADGRAEG